MMRGFRIENLRHPNNDIMRNIGIARGDYSDLSSVHKFGYNSSVGTSFETVWDGNNNYTYFSAGTATVTSSNTAADDGGTVKVFGLDTNYDFIEETLTIGGSAGTKTFARVYRAYLETANTGTANVGTVTVTISTTSAAIIQPTYSQTLMCVYTIPRGYCGYLTQIDIGSSKDLENQITFNTNEIDNGNVWRIREFLTGRGGFLSKTYVTPIKFPPKTDIEIRAKASATSAVAANFELILEKL